MREIFKPVLILLAVCIVMAFFVSLVYNVTDDIIAQKEKEANEVLMNAVLEDAKPFNELTDIEQPSETSVSIANAYISKKGYVFNMVTKGYGGDVTVFVGIKQDGTISNIKLGSNNETPSVGKKAEESFFTDKFIGLDTTKPIEDQVDTISGATITSKGVIEAVQAASDYFSSGNGQEIEKEEK